MCTVSFVSSHSKFIITSNRDEKLGRDSAIEPKNYLVNNKNLIFPKDPKAGGTWYAITQEGTILVLLNGASNKHHVKLPYRRSRGLIVLDIISSISAINEWNKINLETIEPFTLVLFQDLKLYQLQWNGKKKSTINLDISKNYIWSSATLYPKEIRENRANWFHNFLETKPNSTHTDMYNFHRYTENDNQENGLIINRNNEMMTLSITQSVTEKNKITLNYYDLIANKEFTNTLLTI